MKKYGMFIFLFLALSVTSGCSELPAYVENPTIHHLTSDQRVLLAAIERAGIQLIKQGMIFTFIIPTDCFFEKDTRALRPYREKDLFVLAQFLESYSHYFAHPEVIVAGFTDTVWFHRERKLLSAHYAQSIADYLARGGVSSSKMIVDGFGAEMPIASNQYPKGTAYNRRVVVIIR